MPKMYHLTKRNLLQQLLKEGIQISSNDLLPRIYLSDEWQWILRMADFLKGLNKSIPEKDMAIIELDLTGIKVNPDDIPADLLPKTWEQHVKDEYPQHCFYTGENIPASAIKKIYDLNGKDLDEYKTC